jgi:TrmH family RNA methyltransferase
MCVIEKPAQACLKYDKPVIIIDNVQNPGNVGAIIRSADALCRADIILTGSCADIYSGRTQRAAMGAIFRQNIKISENIKIELEILRKNGYNIFAAYLGGNARPLGSVKFSAKSAVIFGSEGAGLSAEVAELCDERVIIPVNPGSESLNVSVAAGIIMWKIGGDI